MTLPYKAISQKQIKKNNRTLILSAIFHKQDITRKKLSEITNLAPSTVSNIVNPLVDKEILVETGLIKTETGKRAATITFNEEEPVVLGVRIQRNFIKAGIFNLKGNLKKEKKVEVKDFWDFENTINTLMKLIKEFKEITESPQKHVLSLGIASPGPIISRKDEIAFITNFSGWKNVNLKEYLTDKLNIDILIEHDVNAAILAEKYLGSYKKEDMIYFSVDRGIGAGILSRNKVLRGVLLTAGEIGHTSIKYNGPECECGNRGCLELYCSTTKLLDKAKKYRHEILPDETQEDELTVKSISEAAAGGNETAKKLLRENAYYFNIGLINLINILATPHIIIGGEIQEAGTIWLNMVKEFFAEKAMDHLANNVKIKFSKLQSSSSFYGAGIAAINHVINNPDIIYKNSS